MEKTRRTRPGPSPIAGDPTLENFQVYLTQEDLSPSTVKGYRADLSHFGRWYEKQNGRPLLVKSLDLMDLTNYRGQMVNVEGKKPATVNRRLETLKRLSRWAQEEGIFPEDIFRQVKAVRVMKRSAPEGLERSELNALLRAAAQSPRGQGKRNYALIQLFLQTGIRLSEAASVRIADADLRPRSGWLRVRYGKGGKERGVPLNASARAALTKYLEERRNPKGEVPLFVSQRRGALSPRAIERILSEAARRAGLEKGRVSAHRLRHVFSLAYLKDHPGALEKLATILGHESLDTTAIYTQPSSKDLTEDLEKSSLNVYG